MRSTDRRQRRSFLRAAASLPVLCATLARGQGEGPRARIAYLTSSSAAANPHYREAFERGLRELGWIRGSNLAIDYRFAEGNLDRLPALAADIVRGRPDLVVVTPTPAALATRNATAAIPLVMIAVVDPVELGLVESLARPGGNITGVAYSVGFESFGKSLDVLKEVVPNARRVAVLANSANPAQSLAVANFKAAAQPLGLELHVLEVRGPGDFDGAFAAMARDRASALVIITDSVFLLHRNRLAELALKYRLPTMHGARESVEAGGLVSYGPNLRDQFHRAATYVDKILKGASPASLPVEQPTRFELVVNLKTARNLSLSIPQSFLARADEVIR